MNNVGELLYIEYTNIDWYEHVVKLLYIRYTNIDWYEHVVKLLYIILGTIILIGSINHVVKLLDDIGKVL